MKCETTNSVLTFVLGVFVVAAAFLVIRTGIQTHQMRQITGVNDAEKNYLIQAQALLNDVTAYNQKNSSPELTKILQIVQTKPAGAK
jgi:hypothetical protein